MAKILLVEDDTNLSEIYQARMEAEGYEVVSASDGESALAVAAKEKPDLVISDVMMPKISGFEMLDILRNTEGLKDTPVIMLTALGQTDDKGRAESLGADRYLVKSQVTLEDIVNAAHALLQGEASPEVMAATASAMTAANEPAVTPSTATPTSQPSAPSGPLDATVPASVAATTAQPADNGQSQPITPTAVADIPVAEPPAAPAATDDSITNGDGQPPDTQPEAPPAQSDNPGPQASQEDTNANFPQGGSPEPAAAPVAAQTGPTATPQQAQAAPTASPTPAPSPLELTELADAKSAAQEAEAINNKIAGFEHRPIAAIRVPATPAPVRRAVPMPLNAVVQAPRPSGAAVPVPTQAPSPQAQPPAPMPAPAATPPTRPVAPTPLPQATPTPPTPPAPQPANPSAAHALDEKVVDRAIEQLLSKSPQGAQPPSSQTSEHGRVLSSDTAAVTRKPDRPAKKVIAPLSHPPQPSLAELVAREEAKDMSQAAYANNLATMVTTPPVADPQPAPESIPQAVLPSSAAQPAAEPQPSVAAAPPALAPTAPAGPTDIQALAKQMAATETDQAAANVVLPGVVAPNAQPADDGSPQPAAAAKPTFDPNSISL